jgi:hypothetical protein
MEYPFFTIGHSTRTVSQFVDLLQASQIELVVDVRHIPRSRTNPQFNRETLADDLATVQIGYARLRLANCETGPQESIFRPTSSGTMPGYNSFMGYDPVDDVTLIIWTSLTISLDGQPTARNEEFR